MKNQLFLFIQNNIFSILVYFFILKKCSLDRIWPLFVFNSVMFDFCDITFGGQITE